MPETLFYEVVYGVVSMRQHSNVPARCQASLVPKKRALN